MITNKKSKQTSNVKQRKFMNRKEHVYSSHIHFESKSKTFESNESKLDELKEFEKFEKFVQLKFSSLIEIVEEDSFEVVDFSIIIF